MELWVEKYRPTTLEEYVGNEIIKDKIADYLKQGSIQNLLFHGVAGTGKTTLAKLIAKNANINLFWGCNDESIISITAALHAAYCCSNTKYIDLDGSFDLAEDLVTGGFELKDGYMHINSQPGFGVTKL